MALLNNVKTNSGIEVPNAYMHISFLRGDKKMIQINVQWHKDKKAKNDGTSFLKQSNYVFIPDLEDGAPNFIKQGYDYLKTLDEYKGAIDIEEE